MPLRYALRLFTPAMPITLTHCFFFFQHYAIDAAFCRFAIAAAATLIYLMPLRHLFSFSPLFFAAITLSYA